MYPRVTAPSLLILGLGVWFSASAQSVISTHSGVLYFFEGSVFIGEEKLEQKFGKFPEIGEGRELRTEDGRAEVLLTPGVFIRLDENSSIKMLSNRLSDTRVELLGGSAILESQEITAGTSVKLTHKQWQMWVPERGVYRIDADPPRLQVYKGEVKVSSAGKPETTAVSVKESEELPLQTVLMPEQALTAGDSFKNWAMNRSQAISEDNTVAAGIVDDPSKTDLAGLDPGGFTYFPMTSYPSLGISNPYGVSFWSPYQSMLYSSCLQPYTYGPYSGWGGGACLFRSALYPGALSPWPTTSLYWGGFAPSTPRFPYRPAPIRVPSPYPHPPAPHAPAPHIGAPHIGAHR
jgi:hypothetical protein